MTRKDVEKSVKEIATDKEPGLFKSRVSSENYELHGTVFTIEALPKTVKLYAVAKFQDLEKLTEKVRGMKESKKPTKAQLQELQMEITKNNLVRNMQMTTFIFRLGCISITGLKNDESKKPVEVKYETIKVNGVNRKILSESVSDGLPDELVAKLGARILQIDTMTPEELDKLDFIVSS